MNTKVYGAFHKDDEIRSISSSGGVFGGLANQIIANQGIVFGARMSKEDTGFVCKHIECHTREDIKSIQGSKYTPSKLGNTFANVKKYLELGTEVMFCGTPCQVSGLLSYLGKSYENLYVIDFICHGIPTPHLLKKIIEEENECEKIQEIQFRNKRHGWENYSFVMRLSDGVDRAYLGRESKFMKMYLSDMYLRPSCYKCHFKGIERESDITLGDFWGVNNWKELDKSELKKGISIVMVHSEKGERLLNACDKQLYFWESSVSVFDKENVYIKNSAEKSYDIKFFKYCFKRMKCEDIIQIYEKTKMIRELTKKIKRKVNNVLARGFK